MKAPFPRKQLGQHFLSDPNILGRIVAGAGVRPGDRVLEVGPGPGGLTRALVAAGATVWAIETDQRMVSHLRGQEALAGVHLVHADALHCDYEELQQQAGGRFRLVANLPYNISGPLIARLIRQRRAFLSLTVMLQREVAERLLAPPGTRTRGSLSVLVQCFCAARPVLRVAPGAFRPPPKVESMVVHLEVRDEPEIAVGDEDTLWRVVRAGFGQRRKTLRNALRSSFPGSPEVFEEVGLSGNERAEALATGTWVRLADALWEQRGER